MSGAALMLASTAADLSLLADALDNTRDTAYAVRVRRLAMRALYLSQDIDARREARRH